MWLIAGIVLYLSVLFLVLQLLRAASRADSRIHRLSKIRDASHQEYSHYIRKMLKVG
jgi:hypothetical protein